MKLPISKQAIGEIMSQMDISKISDTTIRQSVALTGKLEQLSGAEFVRLEIGVPGIKACQIGVDAQKQALDNGIASIYPAISGLPALKESASRFIKAFINQDIGPECIVPTVGSMQAGFNLMMECSQLTPGKDTILYINPGFAPHTLQAKVMGVKRAMFDIYHFRGEKLRAKLEEYMEQGNIAAIVFSNPNNPSWVCLTEEELRIIGECCTKYDVVALEDLAYMCMDFRNDKSKPFEPPYQPTVSRYTDNYVMMISGSKIFSYAGERIAVVAFSPKLFNREYPHLRETYGLGRMGDNFILTFLYVASSGTSHSAQHALAAMMQAAVDGRYNFVEELKEYQRRAIRSKEIFEKHGFTIVYSMDNDENIGDGFYYTIGYKDLDNETLINYFMRCGISAISLSTTGSEQAGIRACVSRLNREQDMVNLDERLALFVKLYDSEKQ
ncbi:MAG: pyridoxal phosphate-dependent aminotransferase [Muribaculaceae bacterium]|nr:pyridoxal phosphate-dependent aminotransferase [Muribaculaceae bacterium]